MKLHLAAFLGMIVLLCGCQEDLKDRQSRKFLIPWQSNKGYSLQQVEIASLEDLDRLSGPVADIRFKPYYDQGFFEGGKVHSHFAKESGTGVYLPMNWITLQAVTAYAHFERLRAVDLRYGTAKYLSWPRRIGLEALVLQNDGSLSQDNAMYESRVDAVILVPYLQRDLPITLNGGVLAHEHFHAIFQNVVVPEIERASGMKGCFDLKFGATEKSARSWRLRVDDPVISNVVVRDRDERINDCVFNWIVIRGLNEGLADFWAWNYTGDANFISHSLAKESSSRRLDISPKKFFPEQALYNLVVRTVEKHGLDSAAENLDGYAYLLGTRYARFLNQWALQQGGRSQVTAKLVSRLQEIGRYIGSKMTSKRLEFADFFAAFFAADGELDELTCRALRQVLHKPDQDDWVIKQCSNRGL